MSKLRILTAAAIGLHVAAVTASAQPAPISPQQAFQKLGLPAQAQKVLLVGPDGHTPVADNNAAITLGEGQYLLVRSAARAQRESIPVPGQAATLRWRFPMGIISPTEDGTGTMETRVWIEAARGGLCYEDGLLKGVLDLILEKVDGPEAEVGLDPPIPVRITAMGAGTDPRNLSVQHTGRPPWEVKVESNQDVDSVLVKVEMAGDPDPFEFHVPALRPELVLGHSPQRIQGWGLESATLTVSIDQNLGSPVKVVLSTDVGTIEPGEVDVSTDTPGHATLRSRGLDGALVTATAFLAVPADTRVEFQWPWIFLVAVLLGGGLGSLGYVLLCRARIEGSPWVRWWGGLVTGIPWPRRPPWGSGSAWNSPPRPRRH